MRVLILVDIQNDFLPGGSLAVPRGDEVIPVANSLAARFDLVAATQDWHPSNHLSFAINQKEVSEFKDSWPVHCVQGTYGADLAAGLNRHYISRVVRKGQDPDVDSYSGFFDNDHKTETGLNAYLTEIGATEVYVLGLATDYCVKATAIDCALLGYQTWVVLDGCRGVDPERVARVIEELQRKGVGLINSNEIFG